MSPESSPISLDLNKNRIQRKPLGFTLVELLVVVSIITILATIAFQVGKSMTERGNSTKCVNNLRQIGMAIAQYSMENDGYLPYSASPDPGLSSLGFSHYEEPLPILLNVGKGSSSFKTSTAYNKPTAKHPFNCPSCKTTSRTYAANMHALSFQGQGLYPLRKTSAMNDISRLILIADDTGGDPAPNNSGQDQFDKSNYLSRIGIRHNGKANMLFADFHVEQLSKTNLQTLKETDNSFTNIFKIK
jgi:prepilin-type processing-associated H-X9-DG protein/prepilin-type N-terminal cleavage/methylation domain-containing protein